MKVLPTVLSIAKEQSSVFFVELYIFRLTTGNLYFAACDEDIPFFIPGTSTPVTYTAIPLEREAIKASVDSVVDSTSVKVANVTDAFTIALFSGMDFTNKVVDIITITYPQSLTDHTAYSWDFRGHMDAPILNRKEGTFAVTLNSPMPDGEPGRTFMLSCNADFGDADDCGASLDTSTGAVGNTSDKHTIYIDQTKDNDYWRFGEITIGSESKAIEGNVGNKITVRYPFYYAPTGVYTISRGCDKTVPTCKLRNNQQNYSGFPSIPFEFVVKT